MSPEILKKQFASFWISFITYFEVLILFCIFSVLVDRSLKRRQVKPLAASLLDALDYDSSDDSDFEVGDASGKHVSII